MGSVGSIYIEKAEGAGEAPGGRGGRGRGIYYSNFKVLLIKRISYYSTIISGSRIKQYDGVRQFSDWLTLYIVKVSTIN